MPTKTHLSPIKSRPADYSVVLITNATSELIQKFIVTQSFLGASSFFIYIDREYDEQEFGHFDHVTFFPVESVYVEDRRPVSFYVLQKVVYQDAYARCQTTWLAVMDTDEIIFHPNKSMRKFLEEIPSEIDHVTAQTYETFWGSFDNCHVQFSAGFCRCPSGAILPNFERRRIYGEASKYVSPRGTVGHAAGKYLVKSGLDMVLEIHSAHRESGRARLNYSSSLGVLHFDAPSFPDWYQKFGAGKTSGGGLQHKSNEFRQALIGELGGVLYHRKNIQIFKNLFCWSAVQRNRYLEYGDMYSLSWKWAAVFHFGTISGENYTRYTRMLVGKKTYFLRITQTLKRLLAKVVSFRSVKKSL